MKTLLLSTATVALILAASTAFAQNDKHHGGGAPHGAAAGPHGGGGKGGGAAHVAVPHGGGGAVHGHIGGMSGPSMSGPKMSRPSVTHRTETMTRHTTVTTGVAVHENNMRDNGQRGSRGTGEQGGNATVRSNAVGGGASRGHADVSALRRNVTARHHYHAGAYRAPSGYSYRRYTYGEHLPSNFFVRDYWITDYSDYGLMEPPYGYVWVRFGPDALLIDEDTGDIVQVVYGQFY